MHRIAIPRDVVAAVMKKRGRLHLFDELDAQRSALIVVDMQNAFVAPGWSRLEVPVSREIVPAINHLAATFRAAGGTVVWTQMAAYDDGSWNVYLYRFLNAQRRAAVLRTLAPGSEGYALYPELELDPADVFFEKTRYSPFHPGGSNFDARLRACGIDTLVITGTLSNICCESLARDAMMLDYNVVFVSDATAAKSDAEHNATLANMMQVFADVMTVEEVESRLRRVKSLVTGPNAV